MISDLLASINGEKSALPSSTVAKPASSAPKRKADETLRAPVAKSPRIGPLDNGPARLGGDTSKPSLQPANKPSLTTSSPVSKSVPAPRPSRGSSTSLARKGNQDAISQQRPTSSPANGNRLGPGRADAKRPPPAASGPKAEPKKRSFAEIMARAKAAQTAGPTLGKIQHKTLERGENKKEREDAKAKGSLKARTAAKREVGKGAGTSHATRNESNLPQARDGQRRGATSSPSGGLANRKKKDVPVVEEKKVKKAALATTGYTGTARPRPGGPSSKSKGSTPGPQSVSRTHPADRRRYGGSLSRSRQEYDDEDDMDDFIEYDDDEEEPPYGYGYGGGRGRGGYESPEESDMEAGMSDIDEEERRAEYQARREDQQEEALERKLKREKEEKKRKLLEAARARPR